MMALSIKLRVWWRKIGCWLSCVSMFVREYLDSYSSLLSTAS